MSEKSPETTGRSRLDNWDANMQSREAWDHALYANAGTEDFSLEAKQRVEEATEYDEYMSKFSGDNRSADVRYIEQVENGEQKDSVDRAIDAVPELRRMNMMAKHIAELRRGPQNEDTLRMIRDKEDKLNELLLSYPFDQNNPDDEDIFNRIADRTVQGAESEPSSEATFSDSHEDGVTTEPEVGDDLESEGEDASIDGSPEDDPESDYDDDEGEGVDPELKDIDDRLDEVLETDSDANTEYESSLSDEEKECFRVMEMTREEYAKLTAQDRESILGRFFRDGSLVSRLASRFPAAVGFLDRFGQADFTEELEQARATYEENVKHYIEIVEARLDENEEYTEEQKRGILTQCLLCEDQRFEMTVVRSQKETSLSATRMSNWWVRQTGWKGNLKKAAAVFGGGLVVGAAAGSIVGALVGAGSAAAYAGMAAGAAFGVNRAKYITDRRANSFVDDDETTTVADLTSQISRERKRDAIEGEMADLEEGGTMSAVEAMVDETESITGEEVLRNRMRTRRMASIAMTAGSIGGGIAGNLVGNAFHGGNHAPSTQPHKNGGGNSQANTQPNHGGGDKGTLPADGAGETLKHTYKIGRGAAPENILRKVAHDQLGRDLNGDQAYRLLEQLTKQVGQENVFKGAKMIEHAPGNHWFPSTGETQGLTDAALKASKQIISSWK